MMTTSTDIRVGLATLDWTSVALVGGSVAIIAGNGGSRSEGGESKDESSSETSEHGSLVRKVVEREREMS